MREFDSPGPISVVIEAYVGHIRVVAADRTTAVVDVRADDRNRRFDVEAVERTRVEYSEGRLRVSAPGPPWGGEAVGRAHGSIEIVVEVPIGSQVRADTGMGTIRTEGRLGDCRLTSSLGDISVGAAESAVTATTTTGSIHVDLITQGRIRLETTMGELDIGVRPGTAAVLDLHTDFGWVRNDLETAGDPGASGRTAEVRARVTTGNIVVRRVA